jgi:hypothetical protein
MIAASRRAVGEVRDFDQFFGCTSIMIDIARNPRSGDTYVRAVRSVVSWEE